MIPIDQFFFARARDKPDEPAALRVIGRGADEIEIFRADAFVYTDYVCPGISKVLGN